MVEYYRIHFYDGISETPKTRRVTKAGVLKRATVSAMFNVDARRMRLLTVPVPPQPPLVIVPNDNGEYKVPAGVQELKVTGPTVEVAAAPEVPATSRTLQDQADAIGSALLKAKHQHAVTVPQPPAPDQIYAGIPAPPAPNAIPINSGAGPVMNPMTALLGLQNLNGGLPQLVYQGRKMSAGDVAAAVPHSGRPRAPARRAAAQTPARPKRGTYAHVNAVRVELAPSTLEPLETVDCYVFKVVKGLDGCVEKSVTLINWEMSAFFGEKEHVLMDKDCNIIEDNETTRDFDAFWGPAFHGRKFYAVVKVDAELRQDVHRHNERSRDPLYVQPKKSGRKSKKRSHDGNMVLRDQLVAAQAQKTKDAFVREVMDVAFKCCLCNDVTIAQQCVCWSCHKIVGCETCIDQFSNRAFTDLMDGGADPAFGRAARLCPKCKVWDGSLTPMRGVYNVQSSLVTVLELKRDAYDE